MGLYTRKQIIKIDNMVRELESIDEKDREIEYLCRRATLSRSEAIIFDTLCYNHGIISY